MTEGNLRKDAFETYFDLQKSLFKDKNGNHVYNYLDDIDTKVGALLTHMSIMLAVSVFTFQQVANSNIYLKYAAGFEVLGYILITLGCLTCVNIITPKKDINSTDMLYEEALSTVKFRLRVYKTCLYSAFTLTTFLAVIFLIHVAL